VNAWTARMPVLLTYFWRRVSRMQLRLEDDGAPISLDGRTRHLLSPVCRPLGVVVGLAHERGRGVCEGQQGLQPRGKPRRGKESETRQDRSLFSAVYNLTRRIISAYGHSPSDARGL